MNPQAEQRPAAHLDFPAGLAEFHERVTELRSTAAGSPQADAILVELEVAYEELRVAEEEVRTQQDEISRLVDARQVARWQHERLLQMLPVPVVTTDGESVIRSANAAAAALLGVRLPYLLRKPLLAYFALEDRREVRRELARSAAGGRWSRVARLVDRAGSPVLVEVVATTEPSGDTTWMFLAPDVAGDRRPPGELSLPEALTKMATLGSLASVGPDEMELLQRCARLIQDVLGPRVSLSVTRGDPAGPDGLASTSHLAQAVDGAQLALDEGPCVTAFQERRTVTSSDVRADGRWPRLSADPRTAEVGGAIAVPVQIGDELIGALNVYGDVGDPVDPQLVEEAELLATGVAALFHELETRAELEETAADLERALVSRATIDQAKGIVMAERGGTPEQAFEFLVRLSSTHNVKLRDLARMLVEQRAGS